MPVFKSIFSLFILAFLYNSVFSQGEFKSGYIVSLTGDTVRYQVEQRNQPNQYEFCRVRFNDKIKKFAPDQILAYGIYNERAYVAGMAEGKFVRVLVKGYLSLYKFQNGFIATKEDETHILSNQPEDPDALGARKRSDKWKGIFSYLISDCPKFQNAESQIKFNEYRLRTLCLEYNNCSGVEPETFQKKEKTHYTIGFNMAYTRFNLETIETLGRMPWLRDYHKFGGISYGAQVAFSSPISYGGFSFILQTRFFHGEDEYNISNINGSVYDIHDVSITFRSVDIPVSVRYLFPNKFVQPYVQLGLLNSFTLDTEAPKRSEYSNPRFDFLADVAFTPRGSVFGWLAEAGLYKNFGLFSIAGSARWSATSNFVVEASMIRDASIRKLDFMFTLSKELEK